MKERNILFLTIVLAMLAMVVLSTPGYSQSPTSDAVAKLRQDAGGDVEITWNPQTGTTSFIRGHIPLTATGLRGPAIPATAAAVVVDRYAGLFGVKQAARELNVVQADVDKLGMTHVTQAQVYQGVEVYGALMKVHLSADGREVVAISSGFVPNIQLATVQPRVTADQALATARKELPNGVLGDTRLVVYPGTGENPGASAKLAWLVELRDDAAPARNVYVVDASDGKLLDVLNRLYEQGPISSSQALNKVAARVIAETEGGAEVEFFIVLADRAYLSYANQLSTKAEKGRYVYQTLWDRAQSTQAPVKAWLDSQGVQYQSFYIVNALLVKGNRNLVMAAAMRGDVERIEANPKVRGVPETIVIPSAKKPAAVDAVEPNIQYVNAPGVWAMGYRGQGVVVGGQDTGYSWSHPALKNQYRGWNGSTASHDYNWHDSIHSGGGTCGANSPAPCDDGKHGTHTMGTAVGSDGGSNQIGMAPGAKWIGCRNMNQGVGSPATYLECFQFFLAPYPVGGTPAQGRPDLSPDVTVNSWGCPPKEGCSWSTLQAAIEAQRAAGIMTEVSAGNDGAQGCSTIGAGNNGGPPALYDAAYTVGALNLGTDTLANFSSRGPVTIDGSNRRKPDITAPGTNIRSSVPSGGYEGGWGGTSMAGPHVAGAIALLWSANPSLIGQVDVTRNYLNSSAVHITSTECSSTGSPNNLFGYGRLDALGSVRNALGLLGRFRETFNTNHTTNLPGTIARTEYQPAIGDQDTDRAHDFAGATYDYFKNTHNRDSFDNNGAAIISTAHYGRNYQNAFWNGTQMVYGDGFAVNDVVAHELTHAVTEKTANLEYRWQSGALNESFSDIFGAMVDRDDWLIGEDLPASVLSGQDAIRDMSNPARLGQPDNASGWVSTCSDNEGVHTNSGITNKAYYNIATAITKDKAERIFYRALTVYLQPTSSLEDARAAALQAAADLYGNNGTEYTAVRDGFNAVGLDGNWNPPSNSCSCGASVALTSAPNGQSVLSDLRAVRDQVFTQDPGLRWARIYYEHQFEVAWLLIKDGQLRADVEKGFRTSDPAFRALVRGPNTSDPVILTREMIQAAEKALMGVAERSSPEVRDHIVSEWKKANPYRFVGWEVNKVWEQLQRENQQNKTYIPFIIR